MDNNPFSALDSEDNDDSETLGGFVDRRKERQDKKRQRVSTGTSGDELYDLYDDDEEEDDDDDINDNGDNGDFMRLSTDQKLAVMFTKISTTEVKVNSIYKEKLSRRVQKIETVMSAHEQRIKLLEYRSIDIEARSRRRNLLFKGITEYGSIENCFELVRDFIADKLKISDDMYLERAHRLGRLKPNQSKSRPIIVAFRDYYDTEIILQAAPGLKNTTYSVCRDYPTEITEARNKLWPHYRKARENPSSKVSIRYPARLVIDGVTTHDMFPDWFRVLKGSRAQTASRTAQSNIGQSSGTDSQQLSGQQGQQSMGHSRNQPLSSSTGGVSKSQAQRTPPRYTSSNVQSTSSVQPQNDVNVNQANVDDLNRAGTSQRQPNICTLSDQRQNGVNVSQSNGHAEALKRTGTGQRQTSITTSAGNNTTPVHGRALSPARPPAHGRAFSPARPQPNDTGTGRGDASSQDDG